MQITKSFIRRNIAWLPLVIVVAWAVVPLLWSLASSFKVAADFRVIPAPFFPSSPTLDGFRKVFDDYRFLTMFGNSLGIAIISTIVAVTLSTFAAYGFSRYALRWRHLLLLFVLVPRLVPRVSLIVPVSQLVRAVPGLYNTQLALVIVYAGAAIPLATWIMIGFIGAIPRDLDEAAKIDGASSLLTFFRVILPLSVPGLLTISVMAFRDAWNEFPFALALTSSWRTRTLPYQLFLFRDSLGGIDDFATIQAFTWVTIIPILIIYIKFEKHVVAGMTSGALK